MFTNDVQQVIVYIILAVVAVLIIVGIVRKLSSKNASCDMGCDCCSQNDCPARKNILEKDKNRR